MRDNKIQGYLELSMLADTYLRSLSINHYLDLPLYEMSLVISGAQLIDLLTKRGLIISPNWLYQVPFHSSFEEIIEERMAHDNYNSSTHWLDYLLTKYLQDKESFDSPFTIDSHETCLNSLLKFYTIGKPNSKNLDETPLIVLFTALRAIIAKRLIKENINDIRHSRSPLNDIEAYF
ncbi:hypothetical protein [Enterococcus gallinarum]|uniref:hypothetical protein n=1 Tax=Enterococcus gallinarum TaxID=1353 RepID=UPI001F587D78|nr:hypothetical protein [Enterococcus gallinarum]MCR1932869.1 hypothetical protein [Enterococcus gallinarum]MCR1945906.1 hypothetical protein [Enterococcus gallinarum]MDQ6112933.1 hypothetical protein [Enterococcus gallinarum]